MNQPTSPFSDLTLFTCTYVSKITNINMSFEQLTPIICSNLRGNILAINSNYGHGAQVGYESFIKQPKEKSETSIHIKGKTRKGQGNGTCFNSAIEPVIKLDNSKTDKIYKIKCFPTTGETQIPGVILSDFSDGGKVLETFVNYLNTLNIGVDGKKIGIAYEKPKMINYKFKLNNMTKFMLVNLFNLAEYLQSIERGEDMGDNIPTPFVIREVKIPVDDIKTSFRMRTSEKRVPRINVFQSGKVNILGSESVSSAEAIYKYLSDIFQLYWDDFIRIKPLSDKDKALLIQQQIA